MSDAAVQTVLSFYSFPPGMVRRIESLGNAGGWSGSQIWKVELDSSAAILSTDGSVGNALRGVPGTASSPAFLCLRRWPREHPTPERLQFIHGVLQRVFEGGLSVIPVPLPARTGESFVEFGANLWELARWMPGIADFHAHPNRVRLRSAMTMLARFHQLAGEPKTIGRPQSMHDRSIQVRNFLGGLSDTVLSGLQSGIHQRLDAVASRVFNAARPLLPFIQARLQASSPLETILQPAIRDIWHDHVLFTGDDVTGVVDFGAMRIDTSLTDIARLVGSLVGDDGDARAFAMDAYAGIRPLNHRDHELIDLLDESGTVLAGLNWLTWLYVDRRDMGPPEPIIRRLDEILRRLEHLAAR